LGKILDELNSEERKCNAYVESRTEEELGKLKEGMEEDEADEEQEKINEHHIEPNSEEADRWLAKRMKIDEDYEKLCGKISECYTKIGKIINRMRD
jgi:hypothetical protein